ncbi:permease, partial [Streptomyces sp. NPDC058247]
SDAMVTALALAAGLLPLLSPGLYEGFPSWARTVLGSGVVAGTLTAVVLSAVFRSWRPGLPEDAGTGVREAG